MTHSSNRYTYSLTAILISTLSSFANSSEQINEKITIVGEKQTYPTDLNGILPITLINTQIVKKSGTVADLFSTAAQVSYNGQGGLLQTVSIRGLSRWRIQTLVEGVPVHTDRRAGNAAGFIAPSLVGSAYVLSGAASTQLGSGGLGGGTDLQLEVSAENKIETAFASQQDYRSVQILGGNESKNSNLYWGMNTRHANNGEDGLNQTIFNGFAQSVGWVRHTSTTSLVKDALLIVSQSDNVRKANSDLVNERQTIYPNSDHWLAKLDFNWMNTRIYAHSANLDTQIVRPLLRTNTLQNSALGWGANIKENFAISDWNINWQLALDARTDVEATEQEETFLGDFVFDRSNLNGRQYAGSLTIDTTKLWLRWQFSSGARIEHMYQSDDSKTYHSEQDSNISGFIGIKRNWAKNWTAELYISSGFRVPSLTERFFFGSTPRGMTLGNPGLKTEHSTNFQADIAYQKYNLLFNLSASRQSINNYIERVALDPSTQQYANLADVQIDGVNYHATWTISSSFDLSIQGQWLWGEDNNGDNLNDVSPHQHNARLNWQSHSQSLWLNAAYRQAHKNPGSSEITTNNVLQLHAGYEHQLTGSITAKVIINNITNKLTPQSTDEQSANTQGRDIQLTMTYVF